jgi:uncharacterized protein (DUF1778 family)
MAKTKVIDKDYKLISLLASKRELWLIDRAVRIKANRSRSAYILSCAVAMAKRAIIDDEKSKRYINQS